MTHWEERVDLACAFRWTARLGMHESVANHFSMAVADGSSRFLINPSGSHFSQVRASDLLVVDVNDSNSIRGPHAPDITALALHGAIHRNVPSARCVMHTHSKYATVLACLKNSTLPPIEQNAMRFFERVAFDHEFDGMGLGEEAERLSRTIGDKPILLMGNHGVIVASHCIAQAFDDLCYFERACEVYITALSTGRPMRVVSDSVARKTARQWMEYPNFANDHFNALKAILDKEEPDYKT